MSEHLLGGVWIDVGDRDGVETGYLATFDLKLDAGAQPTCKVETIFSTAL